ncbi:peptidase C39 [Lysobacter sp. TY2-98]|uniref:C39 family peptidase n=1 Tax=Lysobacter sp. TY2-98 TaxID=2290922 RepID=UPI000E200968|nr:C39 family peptidase [Lysobacter sp. TY2-98]AXK73130.1 peptidase C39 [Lysobacter sp. TY2-98]
MRHGAALLLSLGLGFATLAGATTIEVRPPGQRYGVAVTSLKEARFRTTVRQQYDFSCGSAAAATLLTFQYGHPVSEADVFKQMFTTGDAKRIRKEGFSMLDMRRYLASQGYEADGFQLPLDKLEEEGVPAIVLLNDRGYRHFVVVKGLRGERVLLGDPSRGTRSMTRRQFEKLWDNRVLFVVHNRREFAQFNRPADWRIAPPAPVDTVIRREGVQNFDMPKRGPGDF